MNGEHQVEQGSKDTSPSTEQARAERQARVLAYWKAIELFSPQKIPRLNPNSFTQPVLRVGGRTPLPWDQSEWFQPPDPDRQWRFTAYCGLYKQRRVRTLLAKHFPPDPSSFDQRTNGESCLFAVQITGDGRPLLDTFTLASCAWAAGRLITPGPGDTRWLEGFESAAQRHRLAFAERFAVLENDEVGRRLNQEPGVHVGRPIQPGDLESEVRHFAQVLHVTSALRPLEVRLAARQVSPKYAFQADSEDFLNSFFLQDLDRLIGQAPVGLGAPLSLFLTPDEQVEKEKRCDLRRSMDALEQQTAPQRIPYARWPSDASESLYFSQQLSVNAALETVEAHSPLFGINGPPGTGKTTLLRDVIAVVVVERAKVLATLRHPDQAFAGTPTVWQSGNYRRCVHPWRDDLLGFGVVVASSNNRAVENVTLEIPAERAVAREFLAGVEHFADFAGRILGDKNKGAGPAWGLIAARLGNKKNRRKFVGSFWFADKDAPEPRSRAQRGFLDYLNSAKAGPQDWKQAVDRFDKALQQEAALRAERCAAWQAVETQTRLRQNIDAMHDRQQQAMRSRDALQENMAAIETRFAEAVRKLDAALKRRIGHQAFKPAFVDAVFTLGSAYREWRERELVLSRAMEREQEGVDRIEQERRELLERIGNTTLEVDALGVELAPAESEAAAHANLLRAQKEKLGFAFPDWERWLERADERELSSPWADPTWNRVRSRVFVEALRLHRAFLDTAAPKMKRNLSAAMDILSGKVSPDLDAKALQSAWASLFFVIPVISSTFASFDRLFAHLGREAIGWLLIDEAAQAVPQAAAGALWRSKRAIVLGDPRQLEPIVTLPFTAQQALRMHYAVAETWLPSRNSVQTLVDRVSRFGTWVPSEEADEPVWVGSPLRVHRRCEKAIFRIANQIAYGGQMVYATAERPSLLPESCWIDVSSIDADEHWIPAEGSAVECLLRELFALGIARSQILLISPFRSVSHRLRDVAQRHGVTQVGTVHVAQGKEADVVILVLGGDPQRLGAKEWAAEKPNLLNVAVSRAKQRLYIVGNREEWKDLPHFSDAAAMLPEKKSSKIGPGLTLAKSRKKSTGS